jgi:endoglucanase
MAGDVRPMATMQQHLSRRLFVAGLALGCGAILSGSSSALAEGRPRAGKPRLGVNLAGAEFGKIGGRWKWPQTANLQYYLGKGFNIFRIPFKWDRLQPTLGGPLDETAMQGLDELVRVATTAGAIAVLDSHDYGRRCGVVIGTPGSDISITAFADYWGRIAQRYRGNGLVWYNLMNEPNNQDPATNVAAQNAACAAIRRAGATSKVLFSGTAWSGAKSWVATGNAKVMLMARDPANNFAFDVHQYLGKGHLGKKSLDQLPGIGSRVLEVVTDWARANDRKLFLGEFAVDQQPQSMAEVRGMLDFMAAHADVFVGATYFAGGGTWGRNPNSLDPIDGVDKPQMDMLRQYMS